MLCGTQREVQSIWYTLYLKTALMKIVHWKNHKCSHEKCTPKKPTWERVHMGKNTHGKMRTHAQTDERSVRSRGQTKNQSSKYPKCRFLPITKSMMCWGKFIDFIINTLLTTWVAKSFVKILWRNKTWKLIFLKQVNTLKLTGSRRA